ncbi:MAG: AAA family ATPase [Candidatus Dadabacteria bacterium]|nr:AAA family ATPase [Candidatus Dadabacteria bacterium]
MKQAALISIHPEHIDNIMSGKKVFEYRKILPRRDISFLVLYCTAPVKKILAVAEVVDRVTGLSEYVWNATSLGSGISHCAYRDYYSARRHASYFVLGNVYKITDPMSLSDLSGNRTPPRSFYYLSNVDMKVIFGRQSANPANSPAVLFVGGVHGVGKTSLCRKVSKLGGYRHISASFLIRIGQEKDIQGKKEVENVVKNQLILLQNLKIAKAEYPRVLLDGHFTLINDRNEIEPVNVQIFDAMNPRELVLIKGFPSKIVDRLKDRDHKKWDISFVKEFQAAEEKHAQYVSEQIGVPLHIFDNHITPSSLARAIYKNAL